LTFERLHAVTPVALKEDLIRFPRTIGRWHLTGAKSFPRAFEVAGFDQRLSRNYVTSDGQELDLLVGYFERQQEGRELVGFELAQLVAANVPATASLDAGVRVKEYVTAVGGESHYVTYWYFISDRLASEPYEAKWWTAWNSLVLSRSDGALVMIKAKMGRQEPIDATRARVRDFVDAFMAAWRGHVPST
jgi:EpsI family protein